MQDGAARFLMPPIPEGDRPCRLSPDSSMLSCSIPEVFLHGLNETIKANAHYVPPFGK